MAIRNACYRAACSKTLIQKPEDRFVEEKDQEKRDQKGEVETEKPTRNEEIVNLTKETPTLKEQNVLGDSKLKKAEIPTKQQEFDNLDKPVDAFENKIENSERIISSKPQEASKKIDQTKSDNDKTRERTPETDIRSGTKRGSREAISTAPQSTKDSNEISETKSEKLIPLASSRGMKEEVPLLDKSKKLVPETESKPGVKDDFKAIPELSNPKEIVPALETDQTTKKEVAQNDKGPKESVINPINSDGKKKQKPSEGPTSMQTLGVPKITEPQSQDKSHSIEAVGKQEKELSKLSPDVAKSLSNTKKSLKPVQVR